MSDRPKLAYLYSRYPIVSQTFCDNEMLALEAAGWDLVVGSIYPPLDSLRNANLDALNAPVLHAPPSRVLAELEKKARKSGRWPQAMIDRHDRDYGKSYQAATRARNALYFADRFEELGIQHVHVHFANRATHTALFLREMTGISMSFTTHGQDFMVDLGSDALLNEMCDASAFAVAVCDYSRDLMARKCPASRDKILRIYNGLDPSKFAVKQGPRLSSTTPLRILSVGRLIEFKGFHVLIDAVAAARKLGIDVRLRIIGEGPWQERLESQIAELELEDSVSLLGRQASDEVTRELAESDVFALGCVVDEKGASDLLPTVITEAMLSGLPVISTRVAGVPEMIIDGKTGFVVPPYDPKTFAQALQKLASDPILAMTMGAAGRELAEKLFALDVTVPQLARQFTKAVPDVSVQTAPASPVWAFYDLSLPDRAGWLLAEAPGVDHVIAAGGRASKETIRALAPALNSIEWLPDGMTLEMEWWARTDWRIQLETLRTSIPTAADGEIFLRAARRAVWLAVHLGKALADTRLIYAPGVEESLAVWMAGQLSGVPVALTFETGTGWGGSLLRRMAKDADRFSGDTCDKIKGSEDVLLHGESVARRGHVGPLRWCVPSPPVDATTRLRRLTAWLEEKENV